MKELNIADEFREELKAHLEVSSGEPVYFGYGEWRPHIHVGFIQHGLWAHYGYPTSFGYAVVVYREKGRYSSSRGPSELIYINSNHSHSFIECCGSNEHEWTLDEVEKEWDWFSDEPQNPILDLSFEDMEILETKLLAA